MNATCPQCGTDHLHAAVYVDADVGDRYEVMALGEEDETVIVRANPAGRSSPPEEAVLSCCACDWTADRFIRWESGSPPENRGCE
jgi:hypothetical protein